MKNPRGARAVFAGSPLRYGVFACIGLLFALPAVHAALTDALPEDEVNSPALNTLSPEGEKKVEAMASYMRGLLDEEVDGPEKAFASYRRVLDLEPGFSELALYVAHEHLRRGEAPQAISVLKDALKANPKDMNLCLGLASVYLRQLQKSDIALQYAQKALDANPDEFAPYEAFWEIYMAQNQKLRARQILEKATKSNSVDAAFWLQLGELTARGALSEDGNLSEEDLKKITPLYEKALEHSEGNLSVMARTADYFAASKQPDRAIPIYERILKADPDFSHVLENLAICYARNGQIEEGIDAYEKIIVKDPMKVGAYDEVADLYAQKKDYGKAYTCLKHALIVDPYDPERYQKAGVMALQYLRKPGDAVQIFSDARIRFPSQPEFTRLWAVALGAAKRYPEAMRAFEQTIVEATAQRPGMLDSDFYCNYGEIASDAKLYGRAEELLRKAIEMDPDNASEAYNGLGYMWAERGENLDEAEAMVRQALELRPDEPAYLDSLGWVFYKQGKFKEALAELLRAGEGFANPDPVVYEHIADAYQKLGQTSEAVLYWQKASGLDPQNKSLLAKIDENSKKVAVQPTASPTAQTPAQPVQE